MSFYEVVPIEEIEPGGWTVPDEFVSLCWQRLVEFGKVEQVFWGGSIRDEAAFQRLMHAGVHPLAVCREGVPVFLAWLSRVSNPEWMEAHFTGLAPFRRGMWHAVRDWWARSGIVGLLGIIPETNTSALRLLPLIGWQEIGRIEEWCDMDYLGQKVSGVLHSYRL